MAAASSRVPYVELNEALRRLLPLHGGNHAFAAHDLQQALEGGQVTAVIRYFHTSGTYQECELGSDFWRQHGRIMWRAERGKGTFVTDDPSSGYPSDCKWRAIFVSEREFNGSVHQVLLRGFEQFLAAGPGSSSAPTGPSESKGPKEPKEWVPEAAERLRKDPNHPAHKKDAADLIEAKMREAVKAGTCTGMVTLGYIKNLIGRWP